MLTGWAGALPAIATQYLKHPISSRGSIWLLGGMRGTSTAVAPTAIAGDMVRLMIIL